MEPNSSTSSEQGKTSAKDFFLHLGSIVALYVVAGNFINLLFRIINKAYPEMLTNGYYWSGGSEISFPVATLIIVFPIFVLLTWFVNKTYMQDESKRHLSIRKWLTYITLFVAGVMLAGDLVMVLYKFLDGQDLTAAFLLKALVVLLVSGVVFGFYLQDIRERITAKSRKVWAIVVALIIILSIVLGFSVLGSPQTQRLLRHDNQKIMDLQNLQWQVINYWQVNGSIPVSMPSIPLDPQIGDPYEYKKTSNLTFELCANFNVASRVDSKGRMISESPYWPNDMLKNENWDHSAGRQCFERTIDPVMYPTQVRG